MTKTTWVLMGTLTLATPIQAISQRKLNELNHPVFYTAITAYLASIVFLLCWKPKQHNEKLLKKIESQIRQEKEKYQNQKTIAQITSEHQKQIQSLYNQIKIIKKSFQVITTNHTSQIQLLQKTTSTNTQCLLNNQNHNTSVLNFIKKMTQT